MIGMKALVTGCLLNFILFMSESMIHKTHLQLAIFVFSSLQWRVMRGMSSERDEKEILKNLAVASFAC